MFEIRRKYPKPHTPEQEAEIHKVFAECEELGKSKEDRYHDVTVFTSGKVYTIKSCYIGDIEIKGNDGEVEFFKNENSVYNDSISDMNLSDYFITLVEARKKKLDDLSDENFNQFLKNLKKK